MCDHVGIYYYSLLWQLYVFEHLRVPEGFRFPHKSRDRRNLG